MAGQYPRSGTEVEFDGVRYPKADVLWTDEVVLTCRGSAPPDSRFEYLEKWDAWQTTIPLAECASAYSIRSLATHLGHECQVISSADDGTVVIYYLGHNDGEAEAAGFEQIDKGTYAKVVPFSQLWHYREEWEDRLFKIWRQRFADPEEPR